MADLEILSAYVSLAIPAVLLFWFVYSQWEKHSNVFYTELAGLYVNFTDHVNEIQFDPERETRYSGMIFNIREINNDGYFSGDIDFGEIISTQVGKRLVSDGMFNFMGNFNYWPHTNKRRNPYIISRNRKYKGILYIVERLDLDIKKQKIKDFINYEYTALYYRERRCIEFNLTKEHKKGTKLPKSFTLFKSAGPNTEPLISIREVVFANHTRADK